MPIVVVLTFSFLFWLLFLHLFFSWNTHIIIIIKTPFPPSNDMDRSREDGLVLAACPKVTCGGQQRSRREGWMGDKMSQLII